MTLSVGTQSVESVLRTMTLEKSRSEAAATLSAVLWRAAADTYFPKLSIATGDVVRLMGEDGESVFLGAVQTVERTPETVTLTACDRGIYLTRNELSGVFAGSGAQIAAQVASRLGITLGEVDAESGYRLITARAGHSAFDILRQAAGEEREIFMDGETLRIAKTVGDPVRLSAERVLDVSCRSSIAQMVNRCAVMKASGAIIRTAENAADLAKYGQFQSVESLQGAQSGANAQAKAGLKGKSFTADVTIFGDLGIRCGGVVTAALPDWGLQGSFPVTAVTHRWSGGLFESEMTVSGD